MFRFTLPRDLYHGEGALEALKTFKGKRAIVCVGGGSMKRFGFLDKAVSYLEEAGMEVQLFEGIEPDPSVETVMKGAQAMLDFEPDWIVAIGGGSPIDAAKAMWIKYEYPDITFEDMCKVFGIPALRKRLISALSHQHRVQQPRLQLSQSSQTMRRASSILSLTLKSHLMLLSLTLHLHRQCLKNLLLTQVWMQLHMLLKLMFQQLTAIIQTRLLCTLSR